MACLSRSCSRLTFWCLAALLLLPAPVAAGATLSLQRTAPFDRKLVIPAPVRSECRLETKMIDFIESFAGPDFDKIALVDAASSATPGKALAITITEVSVEGGGAWSGPKHMTIEGTLWQDGHVAGTFKATRFSGGGAWGAYKGTCSLLGRCAKTLGRDVADWLKNPALDSRLGDAK